ncbi:NusG domain II-containing protein [Amedibacillus sp. YH-ame10]
MNKADKIFILVVVISSALFYVPLFWIHAQEKNKAKEVVVSYKNEEVLRVDVSLDHSYHVKGSLGDVIVEIKDKQVRVKRETSPQNLCSIQGWVKDSNRPIVCLPNNIVVMIEAVDEENGDDVVIQ